jgi:short-subunit dehydrogenase
MMKDKVVVITGSSQGIGKACAWDLAQRGARVVLNGRSADKLAQTYESFRKAGFEGMAIQGDIADANCCDKIIRDTVQAYGKVDYLINNAALSSKLSAAEELSPTVYEQMFRVNSLGSIQMSVAALPYLKKTKGGLLFISTLAAIHGIPEASAYSSSKMALTAFAQSLRLELKHQDVYVGVAYLGFVENDAKKTIFDEDGKLVKQPDHGFAKATPPSAIAPELSKMLIQRKRYRYFSGMGKALVALQRISPWLLEQTMSTIYQRRKAGE